MRRVLCWFSAGGPSAVAAKLMLAEHGHDNVVIAYTDPGSEHEDNFRFIADCEKWFDHPVVILRSEKYVDTWDVWEKRKFLLGPTGSPCTIELKKKMRFAFEQPDDVQVFGYTAGEEDRADRFRQLNPEVDLRTPLIERGLTRNDCLAVIDRAGIEIPAMYRLGYQNANCQICPKGGMGYMNKVRVDFPDLFERMAGLERKLGHSVLKDKDGPVWLDELDPSRGDYPTEPKVECGLLCAITEADLETA